MPLIPAGTPAASGATFEEHCAWMEAHTFKWAFGGWLTLVGSQPPILTLLRSLTHIYGHVVVTRDGKQGVKFLPAWLKDSHRVATRIGFYPLDGPRPHSYFSGDALNLSVGFLMPCSAFAAGLLLFLHGLLISCTAKKATLLHLWRKSWVPCLVLSRVWGFTKGHPWGCFCRWQLKPLLRVW